MKIQIDGVNTQNKGAELMLVAILEELSNNFPNAVVYINPDSKFDINKLPKFNTKIKLRFGLILGRYINPLFAKIGIKQPLNYFKENYAMKSIDIVLDASGFKYSDQWKRSIKWIYEKEKYYQKLTSNKTKIIFLTQAFGPFLTENGKKSFQVLDKYCTLIFAREKTSHNIIFDIALNKDKIFQSYDFTLKVKGNVPKKYQYLQDSVAIIPNKKMVSHGNKNQLKYINLLVKSINYFKSLNLNVFLLNHESEGDLQICREINSKLEEKIEIIFGLKAKEVKGLIGVSQFVLSSRFHGVASALSQGVPCVSTSWNHKYEELFKDFGQKNCIINSEASLEDSLEKIRLTYENKEEITAVLMANKKNIVGQIDNMWSLVFNQFFL